MKLTAILALAAVATLSTAGTAAAQSWTGLYAGGTLGGAFLRNGAERVAFDTNLDGQFADTVRTSAGADAFSPGFCAGSATATTPGAGCAENEDGIDFGGRLGYDWGMGRIVFGGLVEVSRPDVTDAVTAFSTTPANYIFSRELEHLGALRGRIGFGTSRMLIYGTGGGAWARAEQSFSSSNRVNTFVRADGEAAESKDMLWGYQAGGGVEIRFGARVSLVGEYLYTSLDGRDESTIRAQGPAPATNPFILTNASGTDLRREGRFELQTARAGVVFRF